MPRQPSGYYSSPDKNVLRDHFDLPLLRQLYERKGEPLSYFGLPGAEALDLKAWKELIGEVGAVERDAHNLGLLAQVLDVQFPEIRFKTHFGEIDQVILRNRGWEQTVGGERYMPHAANCYEGFVDGFVWRYDVVYLDYFGPFLPSGRQGGKAKRRAIALSRLLDRDRVDAWQPWVLLITVEAELYNQSARKTLRDYLEETGADASSDTYQALEFLLSSAPTPVEATTRLIHGATAVLVADSAKPKGVMAKPRGTVLYSGAKGQPMVHMAFELLPNPRVLSGTSDRLSLLSAPILCTKNPSGEPWFHLLREQCPAVTPDSVRMSLDFLEPQAVREILNSLV